MNRANKETKNRYLKIIAIIASGALLVVFGALFAFRLGIFFGGNADYNLISLITRFGDEEEADVQKIGDVTFEKVDVSYVGGTSKLITKVTNTGALKYGVRFRVILMNRTGNKIAEAIGYVGKLNTNESKNIEIYMSEDIFDATNVIYKLL